MTNKRAKKLMMAMGEQPRGIEEKIKKLKEAAKEHNEIFNNRDAVLYLALKYLVIATRNNPECGLKATMLYRMYRIGFMPVEPFALEAADLYRESLK